jgi:hypothetical protein
MPNIVIYGFSPNSDPEEAVAELKLRTAIQEALTGAKYCNEVVFTTIESQVTDMNGENSPYLCIWTTREEESTDITHRLEPLDIDIEVPPFLRYFIPKKSVQESARQKLLGLRPVAGSDPDFDYGRDLKGGHVDDQ